MKILYLLNRKWYLKLDFEKPFKINGPNFFSQVLISIYGNQKTKDSTGTQILNVNRPSNHPSTTKTLGQPRAPKKNGRYTWLSYYHNVYHNVHGQHLSSGTKLFTILKICFRVLHERV